jgi:hypothetical protein
VCKKNTILTLVHLLVLFCESCLKLENHSKTVFFPLSAHQRLLFEVFKVPVIFHTESRKISHRHAAFFKSAIFFVHQNGHWNNTLILKEPLLSSHMLQLYSKQEMTKRSLLHLHATTEVVASSSSVISHSVQKLFVCIT